MISTTDLFAGRYRILRKLGEGGMGTVFLGEDILLQRQIAIKVPHPHISHTEGVVNRFLREAQMAAQINHPNFCRVYDVGVVDGRYFLTMDYIDGTPLSKLIHRERPWAIRDAVDLVRQLAQALQVLHQQGIIHRDLKPSNVMIHKQGLPILMDFGLARPVAKNTTLGSHPLGTPGYMAPEQINAALGEVGPSTDIYGLGVILFQLLTSKLPFRGSPMEVFSLVIQEPAPAPQTLRPEIDPWLNELCLQTLAKKPQERPPSMGDLAARLHAHLTHYQGGYPSVPPTKMIVGIPTPPPIDRTLSPSRPAIPLADPTMLNPPPPDPTMFPPIAPPDPTMLGPRLPPFPAEELRETPITPAPRLSTVADPPSSLKHLAEVSQPLPEGPTIVGLPVDPLSEPPTVAPPLGLLPPLTMTDVTRRAEPKLPPVPVPRLNTEKQVASRTANPPRAWLGWIVAGVLAAVVTGTVAFVSVSGGWQVLGAWFEGLFAATPTVPPSRTTPDTTPIRPGVLTWETRVKGDIALRRGESTVVLIGLSGDEVNKSLMIGATAGGNTNVQVDGVSNRIASRGPKNAKTALTIEIGRVPEWDPAAIPVAIHVGHEVPPGTYLVRLSASTETAGPVESELRIVVDNSPVLEPQFTDELKMIRISAGFFLMGNPAVQSVEMGDCPLHRVILKRTFYMSETEVTVEEYSRIVTGKRVPGLTPQRGMSDKEAVDFCELLNAKHKTKMKTNPSLEARHYRLPWEMEWEFACRAGSEGTRFAFGDDLQPNQAVFTTTKTRSDPLSVRVGCVPNNWGLYDMHGNVREWCQDMYDENAYTTEGVNDIREGPTGITKVAKPRRVVRGGSVDQTQEYCTSFRRDSYPVDLPHTHCGIRVVCDPSR